jgi:hypothetical protein
LGDRYTNIRANISAKKLKKHWFYVIESY